MAFTVAFARRFWSNVLIDDGDKCWPWTGYTNAQGYGRVGYRGSVGYAHRAAWEMTSGTAIPFGGTVLHRCDNPGCVNPSHLWLGTQIENMRDKRLKGRARNQHTKGR